MPLKINRVQFSSSHNVSAVVTSAISQMYIDLNLKGIPICTHNLNYANRLPPLHCPYLGNTSRYGQFYFVESIEFIIKTRKKCCHQLKYLIAVKKDKKKKRMYKDRALGMPVLR